MYYLKVKISGGETPPGYSTQALSEYEKAESTQTALKNKSQFSYCTDPVIWNAAQKYGWAL